MNPAELPGRNADVGRKLGGGRERGAGDGERLARGLGAFDAGMSGRGLEVVSKRGEGRGKDMFSIAGRLTDARVGCATPERRAERVGRVGFIEVDVLTEGDAIEGGDEGGVTTRKVGGDADG